MTDLSSPTPAPGAAADKRHILPVFAGLMVTMLLASLDQTGDGTLKAVLSVTPGKRYKIGDIVINAGPTVPPSLVRDSLRRVVHRGGHRHRERQDLPRRR